MQVDPLTGALITAALYAWRGVQVAVIIVGKPRSFRDVAAFAYAALLWPVVRI